MVSSSGLSTRGTKRSRSTAEVGGTGGTSLKDGRKIQEMTPGQSEGEVQKDMRDGGTLH